MIKYRGLGYTLEDSMKTYQEFKNLSELKKYIKTKNPKYKYIKIEYYDNTPNERTGWKHTSVLMAAGKDKIYYTCGFVCVEGDEDGS